jgi:hypothetical protein
LERHYLTLGGVRRGQPHDLGGDRQKGAEVARELELIAIEVARGDTDAAPAVDGERAVAGAIGLEGGVGVVILAAVELDDEALLGPGAIGFDLEGAEVELQVASGGWEFVTAEEGCEALLEVAPGDASPKAGIWPGPLECLRCRAGPGGDRAPPRGSEG